MKQSLTLYTPSNYINWINVWQKISYPTSMRGDVGSNPTQGNIKLRFGNLPGHSRELQNSLGLFRN